MRLLWSPAARDDLDTAIDWIFRDRPLAAINQLFEIERQAEELKVHPERGRPGRVAGTRELVITRSPFLVIYRIVEDRIEILRVIHGTREWPPTGTPAPRSS